MIITGGEEGLMSHERVHKMNYFSNSNNHCLIPFCGTNVHKNSIDHGCGKP